MSIVTDGPRSEKWRPFAKQKLQMLKDLGLSAKNYIVDGYHISLLTLDDIDKARITAPPGIVVAHIEPSTYAGPFAGIGFPTHPHRVSPGVSAYVVRLAEPFAAGLLGPVTLDGGINNVARTGWDISVGNGGARRVFYDAPGAGVIIPFGDDFYCLAEAHWDFALAGNGLIAGDIHAVTTNLQVASRVSAAAYSAYSTSSPFSVGSQVVVDGVIFGATVFPFESQIHLTAVAPGLELGAFFDPEALLGHEIRAVDVVVYAAPNSGAARVALLASDPERSTQNPANVDGVFFFDVTAGESLDWSYAGFCSLNGIAADLGVSSATNILPFLMGQHVGTHGSARSQMCMFPSGVGVIIAGNPGNPGAVSDPLDYPGPRAYFFAPGQVWASVGGSLPSGYSDPYNWPVVTRGDDTYICSIEQVRDTGVETQPEYEIMSLHVGSLAGWTAIAKPPGAMSALRPLMASNGRVVLLAVVGGEDGSFVFLLDTAVSADWKRLGKVSDGSLLRPIIGIYGKHPFTRLAAVFPGSFPVTTRAGPRTMAESVAFGG